MFQKLFQELLSSFLSFFRSSFLQGITGRTCDRRLPQAAGTLTSAKSAANTQMEASLKQLTISSSVIKKPLTGGGHKSYRKEPIEEEGKVQAMLLGCVRASGNIRANDLSKSGVQVGNGEWMRMELRAGSETMQGAPRKKATQATRSAALPLSRGPPRQWGGGSLCITLPLCMETTAFHGATVCRVAISAELIGCRIRYGKRPLVGKYTAQRPLLPSAHVPCKTGKSSPTTGVLQRKAY